MAEPRGRSGGTNRDTGSRGPRLSRWNDPKNPREPERQPRKGFPPDALKRRKPFSADSLEDKIVGPTRPPIPPARMPTVTPYDILRKDRAARQASLDGAQKRPQTRGIQPASFRTDTEPEDTPHRNSPYPIVDPDELDGWHQEFPHFTKQEILNALQGRDPGLMAVLNRTYRSGGNPGIPLRTAPTPRKDDYRYGVPEGGSGISRPLNPVQGAIENTGRVLKMPFEGLGMLTDRTVDAGADILRLLSGPPIWEVLGDGLPPWREDEKPKFADEKESTTQALWRDLIRELIHGPRKPEDED